MQTSGDPDSQWEQFVREETDPKWRRPSRWAWPVVILGVCLLVATWIAAMAARYGHGMPPMMALIALILGVLGVGCLGLGFALRTGH